MLKVPQKRFAHGDERVGILLSARGTGPCCFLSPLSSSSPPSADDALFLSLNLLPLPTEGATARAHPSFSHKLFPCSPHFHSQIGGGGPRHAHPLSQLDSTLDPFDELPLPLTSAMWPWLRGWINITRAVPSGDEAGPPAPIHGQRGPLFPTTPTSGPRWGRLATPESVCSIRRSQSISLQLSFMAKLRVLFHLASLFRVALGSSFSILSFSLMGRSAFLNFNVDWNGSRLYDSAAADETSRQTDRSLQREMRH